RVFGRPTDERSEVMTTWDDRHLYIAARFQLKDADSLKAEAETASQVPSDDAFVVQFRRDKKAGYGELLVNAKGITLARLQRREGNWNPENIKASSRVHGSQWTTEITVPWKALPTPAEKPHTLRVQFIRKRHNQRYTFDCWSPILASWWGSFEPRFGRLKVQ
ncbi:MAG: hypothetical protein QF473_24345, partial [Planctomycetota bacterium]|nr:hypothetical protein [Planctomycetota bacterium]